MALVQVKAAHMRQSPVSRGKSLGLALALVESRADEVTIVSADSAFRAAAGASEKVLGRRFDEICSARDAARLRSLVERCVAAGIPGRIEGVFPSTDHPGGRRAWVLPVGWSEDEARQAILSISSISSSHQQTAQSEALFDQLGTITAGMLYIYDLSHHRTRYIHPHLAEILGLAPDGATLGEVQERLHPDDLEALARHIAEMAALKDHEVTEAKVRLRGRDGEWRVIRSRARVFVRAKNGEVRRVIGVASDITEGLAQAEALARAQENLARAEAEERRRIGRELHDSTAQHLLAIRLSLGALERRVRFSKEHQPILRDIREALAAAHQEIRAFSFALHPPGAEGRRLPERLQTFADGFGRRTSLAISMKVVGREQAMTAGVETTLFRILQEALMNVHRHTSACRVEVTLVYRDEEFLLEVEDDGGVLGEDALPRLEEGTGVGLASMESRLLEYGGRLRLEQGVGGLRLLARIPRPGEAGAARPIHALISGKALAAEERSFAPIEGFRQGPLPF